MSMQIGSRDITADPGVTDAIHVPVIVATADCILSAGEKVFVDQNFIANSYPSAYALPESQTGIVDPFLKGEVNYGQKFLVFIDPSSVETIRHQWIKKKPA